MKVSINQVVEYKGHTLKQTGALTLSLFAPYDGITGSVQLLQLINEDVTLKAKIPNKKPIFIGIFKINGINFAKDGKSTIKLASVNTAVDTDNLSELITEGSFQVQYSGNVEEENEEES